MRWSIFCRVIDNYGDAGLCWRLAADLNARGEDVTLWIDQPDILDKLIGADTRHTVHIRPWPADDVSYRTADVCDVVIEAFACDPPAAYVAAMAERACGGQSTVWINLEYLSAEAWVGAHHRLPSPHPRYPLVKYFYFPGFTPESGGLLRETDIVIPDRERVAPLLPQALRIYLFSYAQPALPSWVLTLENVVLSVAPCPATEQIDRITQPLAPTLTLRYLPFVRQKKFDAVLREHDLLFVRGEDSFVRAQWAARPVFWHIYPQAEGAHLEKLRAFYTRYLDPAILNAKQREIFLHFVLAWNGDGDPEDCALLWPEIFRMLPALRENALAWRESLLKQIDLVTQLRAFVADLVK